jgi:hypothetical protein
MRGWIIRLGLLAVIGVGAFVFRDRLSSNAGELKVGDCYDHPTAGQTISDVQHHPCTESHTAEVVFVGKMPDAASIPASSAIDTWAASNCIPAWETYTGKTFADQAVLDMGYYKPTKDGWGSGDRVVICYTIRVDSKPMLASVKKS